ncbi:hypothetical protein V1264_013629 [Littorina saxatilis]|uniref:Tetraspanin n=2 Tax=Littorina saxatilis TaxID=31220 RepID=A0AAN9BQ45_9CAEN
MFAVGLTVHLNAEFSQKAFSSFVDKLDEAAKEAGKSVDTSDFNIAEVVGSITIVLIVLGLVIAIVAFLGITGATCCVKHVLIVYLVITLVLFLAQLIMLLIFVIDRSVYDDAVKPALKDTIQEEFTGFEGNDAPSLIWNALMIELKCCGVDSYRDFTGAKKWSDGLSNGGTYVIPRACCEEINNDKTCTNGIVDADNNKNTGCYEKLYDYVVSDAVVIGAAAGVLGFQLLLLILTIVILKTAAAVEPDF